MLWDVVLHRFGGGSTFTPYGYPWLCAGFDLLVAGRPGVQQVRGMPLAQASSPGHRR